MITLEELSAGALIAGLVPSGPAKVVHVEWFGSQAAKVTFEDGSGRVANRLVYRADEQALSLVERGQPWSFDGDGALFRLASEAQRIRLAHLFDPYLAVHTSRIEPLPHQITAVYGEMLPRQPLRFLLADDPGAGKTIMAGLFIKELQVRADLQRCLIVAPGSLVEQWQDELDQKFGLAFDILTRDAFEASRTGNPFEERDLLIARLDMLARNDDLQSLVEGAREWDLVVCDEAHRMSATFFGREVKYTRRYQLGQMVGSKCRHLLLMTATPHNGKEEDFQLFMALLDADRFEGRFRDGIHKSDASDMMRRLIKEELLRFDGKPLFPERRAHTVQYELSGPEAALYHEVTEYVRDEMNRAERFAQGDVRRQNVGFALQILQRRLASSPAAIHESLRRRLARLERRLEEERLLSRGERPLRQETAVAFGDPDDLEEATQAELEEAEEQVLDRATAARNVEELEREIETLKRLERQAALVRRSGQDAKWLQLNSILDDPLMTDTSGNRRKLIVFTEPRDTLEYLAGRIRTRLGRPEGVVVIHGGIGREERRKAQEAFLYDPEVLVLVANDAAGEGVNLQRAHLMVNYDLPWNPNRLEQRFGRIHRIGQTEVCHLWNLVAKDTREGAVYARLLEKIEVARAALGGRVYDVLGRLFDARPLRDLLFDAVRYGDSPEAKARLVQQVDNAADRARVEGLLAERALVRDTLTLAQVAAVREEMERAEARRLQPFHIQSFFLEAFRRMGGRIHRREEGRWEITRVPGPLRERDRQIGRAAPLQERYERVCFDKERIAGPPVAAYLCPGHPLLDSLVDLTLERHSDLLRLGAVLIDEAAEDDQVRVLFALEHAVQDGRSDGRGGQRIISQSLQFIEIDEAGRARDAGPAPYLDYRPIEGAERALIVQALESPWLSGDLESKAMAHAIEHVIPRHVDAVRRRRLPEIDKVEREVESRLKREIIHWSNRAQRLKEDESAGKKTRLSWQMAEARAERIADRLQARLAELGRERDISALPPVIRGGALVVPLGLIRRLDRQPEPEGFAEEPDAVSRAEIERLAMEAVMAAECALGREPQDVNALNEGYDILSREARPDGTARQHFIEVKGRHAEAETVTVTRNEIVAGLNKRADFVLAIVRVADGFAHQPAYIRAPFTREPEDFAASSTFALRDLLKMARAAH